MKNSVLIKTWQALPDAQRRLIAKAVRSPLFNQREEVARLLDFIEKHASESPAKTGRRKADGFTKEAAFQYVFEGSSKKNGTYDDGKMRHLMAYLLEVIRNCLAWQEWSSEPSNVNLHLCYALKKLGANEFWEKELERSKATLDQSAFRNDGYYFHQFALEQEVWELGRQKHRSGVDNVEAMNQAFGVFVAVNSFRQGCSLLAQKSMSNVSAIIPYLPETLRLVEQGVFRDNAAVETWHASYVALAEPENEAHFMRLKALLAKNGGVFPNPDLRDLYILALNVCIRRINAADKKYMREAFDLYRGGLERRVFLENGYLSKTTYRNVMNIAVGVGEWDWAFSYLQEFQSFLSPKDRENIYRYNLATYYFRKQEYDAALELLRHVELREMLENFDARRMMVRMYYEQGELQALESLLDSFDIYLRRHREGGYHREMYRNFVRFMKKMIVPAKRSATERGKLKKEITQTEYLAEREWLLSLY
ncbi:MAG: tetratricopeptide repeat protein [Saprospiraceae bacterium]